MNQKPTPFLWFDNRAEEAMNFYAGIFKDSKIGNIARYGEGAPLPAGTAMSVSYSLNGQEVMALNGGPMFNFTEAFSFYVSCETQDEVDYYWNALIADGGAPGPCGWLKDKFGLSWQIIPTALGRLLGDPDPAKAGRAMQAMLKMSKLVIADLEAA